jgi:diadenosine tetraphosphate (Ap4A) HIT family hydrolase
MIMPTLIHRRVETARQGTNPTVICQVSSGWVVLCDVQAVPGQSILLPDRVVPDLNALAMEQRINFLQDMTVLGDALLKVTGAVRINYEILGNAEPALHAHVIPRYANESEDKRSKPIWFYDWNSSPQFDLKRDRQLMNEIAGEIKHYQGILSNE